MYEIGVRRKFSAAHRLRNYNGKCENLHGHNYTVEMTVRGSDLVDGMLMDFAQLKLKLDSVLKILDHGYINDIAPFTEIEPSAENIAQYLYTSLAVQISGTAAISSVKVWESDDNWAIYRPDK